MHDCVDKWLLLEWLACLGIWGKVLPCIAAMYIIACTVGWQRKYCIQNNIGVEQGGPIVTVVVLIVYK